ncbi:MAG: FkbM family methyltransferase [Magnetococcales bacterium]|nr:FkbM family methyltransferase [Magnetococcales bacterium]
MNTAFHDRIQPTKKTIIVDAGANPLDPTDHYRPLLTHTPAHLFGFEPQAEALMALKARQGNQESYLPYLLGDGQPHTLRICRASVMTSLLEPDPIRCALFHRFDQLTEVIERRIVLTKSLDELSEIPPIDYLKMNVCGAEKMILVHGHQKLADIAAIQLEVSFTPLYYFQPTIGEMDTLLRSMGMIPHAMPVIKKWGIKPLVIHDCQEWPMHQLLVAEMVYVVDYRDPGRIPTELLKQMVLILHYCYQSVDLVLFCLQELARRKAIDSDPERWYLESLMLLPQDTV